MWGLLGVESDFRDTLTFSLPVTDTVGTLLLSQALFRHQIYLHLRFVSHHRATQPGIVMTP